MALQISDTTPRVQYTATSGQTTFSVPFEFFVAADLKVYNGTSLLTYSTSPASASQYSVTGAGVTGGGSITLGSPGATLNDSITIVRDLAIERVSDFPVSGNFPIQTLNTELDKIVAMLQQLEEQFGRTLQYPVTTTTGFNVDLPELVANRVLSVNADATALLANQELGTFKGNWAASTSYQIRDLVKDTSNGNIYFVNSAHTSSGSQPLSSNANSAKYDLIIDAASATTSATNAASSASAASSSATAAANSATAAAASESAAATSESNAATSESNAASSASTATTQATNASNSATSASNSASTATTQATNASNSATSASNSATTATTQATNASNSATAAASSASTATAQASAASTSATNAANSASSASTSASNASTSETNASNSASAASTSATNASNSASAAAASAASAANSYDQFDDRYLGSKTSDPTLDNDGNALVAGALYFNSNANEMRVYDGGNWIPASSAGSASLILYEYTATSGQTTFSGTDDNSATLSYSVNNIIVTLNGVTLDPSDYTATSGTSIVLGTGATTGDLLNVYAFKSFTVSELNANNLTDGTVPNARVSGAYTGITSVGTLSGLTVNGGGSFTQAGGGLKVFNNGTAGYNANIFFGVSNQTDGWSIGQGITANDGVFRLYDNGAGQARMAVTTGGDISFYEDTGTTPKLFWDASAESLGVGTSSPQQLLHLKSNNPGGKIRLEMGQTGVANNDVTGEIQFYHNDASGAGVNADIKGICTSSVGAGALTFGTGTTSTTERMRIDGSGNVSIGKTSSAGKILELYSSTNTAMRIHNSTTGTGNNDGLLIEMNGSDVLIYNYENGIMKFGTNNGERMRIDTDGRLLVGTSSNLDFGSGTTKGIVIDGLNGSVVASRNSEAPLFLQRSGSDGSVAIFYNDTSAVGSISVSGASTAYNTSSDYRLKENITEVTGATERLKQLQPKRFNFIGDADTTVDGFLAHEVSSIVPEAITGTKDEVDADGNPVYQGIDQSKLVPLLTASLKEAIAKIEELETRIEALENA